jgi:hypothetical protein
MDSDGRGCPSQDDPAERREEQAAAAAHAVPHYAGTPEERDADRAAAEDERSDELREPSRARAMARARAIARLPKRLAVPQALARARSRTIEFCGALRVERPPARASFDPVRVEAERYDAIYGYRTGTVDNIAPIASAEPGDAPANATAAAA